MERPKTDPRILRRQLDGEWILFDPDAESIHIINDMASFVWTLCDGNRTVDDMVDAIDERFDIPDRDQVTRDVEGVLESFASIGAFRSN